MMIKQISSLIAFLSLTTLLFASDDARLMRYPDINGNQIVFVYAGDIWTVESQGGNARQLTSHEGVELFPKLSPDGKWIAFSAEYSGSRQIWIMPANGGTARQLTWYNSVGVMPARGGYDHVVLDWTSDSRQILIRANRTPFGDRNGMYFLVNIDGGFETALPIVNGGFGVLSPDNSKICFTPVDREFRTWKRYKGGRATDLWIYNLRANTSEQITSFVGTDQWPTWNGDDIFYTSDRDLRLNLYRYNTVNKSEQQITFHKDFDVMWPSGNGNRIVYENGGLLYCLNTDNGKSEKITVNINYDNPNLLPYIKNVSDDIHSAAISPTGKRALFDARGDIFSIPAENGIVENLTQTPANREIFPSWSPNGKYIAYYSDATGEYEVYLLENKTGAIPKQLTKDSRAWKYEAEWSPNSRYLIYSDLTLKLYLLDIETGRQLAIDQGTQGEIRSYNFSPDSQWITYTKEASNNNDVIWVYNIASGKSTQLTNSTFSNFDPVFSGCGKFIFFVSNRDFNLAFSSFEFDYLYNDASRIYAIALQNDGTKLTKDKNDLEPIVDSKKETTQQKGSKENQKNEKTANNEPAKTSIDFEAIDNRVMALPVPAGDYTIVGRVENGLLYAAKGKLMRYNMTDEKVEEIMDGIDAAHPSFDGKTFLYKNGKDFGIAKVSTGQKTGDGKLNLSKMELKIDPRQEWNQIYTDAWRIFRDYFYVDNMHNVDWKAIKQQYGALLPSVPSRFDLDYLLNEIVSETNIGHAYVDWGDIKRVKRINTGLLGAQLKPDATTGRYRLEKIYPGENWNPQRRSPLTEPGINIKEGDYLLSINGNNITTQDNPYRFLENKADVSIEITVSSSTSLNARRSYTIKPIESELELIHLNWVNERRSMVEKLSNGRIGYIYLPNTAVDGNRELYRGIYAYHDKEALIIDDRYNGGGFIPDRMINLLQRRTLAYWHKNGLQPMTSPDVAHNGPKAMLINGYSSSGGDALPYFFRKTNQGKLIGTRTWGGLVGISANARLVDGGYISVPRFGIYDEQGKWIIEGVGVYPDIEVVDRPEKLAAGEDPCIERAVQELLKELESSPTNKIPSPQAPDRSRWIENEIK